MNKINDLISRQAAIDAICKEGTRLERNGTVAMCEIKQWCIDLLERLPSAQPEPCEDAVSREAVSSWLKQYGQDVLHGKYKFSLMYIWKNLMDLPSAQPVQWIPCSERLPEEDHWLGGSGRQFSDEVMVSVANYDDEDIWIDISQTIDGQWALELPSHCEIIAWIPLPEPYTKRRGK